MIWPCCHSSFHGRLEFAVGSVTFAVPGAEGELATRSTPHKPVQETSALTNKSWPAGAACSVRMCVYVRLRVHMSQHPEGQSVCAMPWSRYTQRCLAQQLHNKIKANLEDLISLV